MKCNFTHLLAPLVIREGEFLDSAKSLLFESTILVFAVEIVEFLANFTGNFVLSDETRLDVCEHSKFAKSTQGAPKDEFISKIHA